MIEYPIVSQDAAGIVTRTWPARTPEAHNQAWSTITSTPTTLVGYGITDAQPVDADLTAIAMLTTTVFGRGLLTQADAAATRATIGAGTSNFNGAYGSLSGIPSTFTPASHTHGNITNVGAIGSTANLPLITGASGVIQVGSFGTTANTFCQGNDSRLSDARTPTAHVHGNISNGGAIGSTASLIVGTGVSGVLETKSAEDVRSIINLNTGSIGMEVDGHDVVIPLNPVKGHIYIPFACTITGWELISNETTNLEVEIWKDSYANYPPTGADIISGSSNPSITGGIKANSTSLPGWTTALNAGDYVKLAVILNSASTWFTLILKVTRT
jgi:hypothetical protein